MKLLKQINVDTIVLVIKTLIQLLQVAKMFKSKIILLKAKIR